MAAKVLGILLLAAGLAALGTGIYGITTVFDGETPHVPGIVMRLFGGMVLLMGGAFTLAFTARARLGRGLSSFIRRLHGSRIDEEIARLAKLRADGYITGAEYEEAKKKLLADI